MFRKKRGPRLGLLAGLMVLGLASLGIANGLWSETLHINGTVTTGEVDAKWSGAICREFHPWPFDLNTSLPGEVEDKEVGSTTVAADPNNDQILNFTITNGYPSYSVDCEIEFVNSGSVPWVIRGWLIEGYDGAPNGALQPLTNCSFSSALLTLTCDELTVVVADGIGAQVEPGGRPEASSLRVHVEQPALEATTYQFSVWVCMAQWNETVNSDTCFAEAPTPEDG